MMKFEYLDLHTLDPYFNLASEEYLIDHTDEDIFMLWRNDRSVIIGRNQNTYAEINEQMEIITVYVDYKPSDIKNREIRIMANDEELPRITVSPSNSGDAYRQFENALESRIKNAEDAGKPAIISIDTTQILYRDERAVQEIIDGLFDRHDNLFSKKIK